MEKPKERRLLRATPRPNFQIASKGSAQLQRLQFRFLMNVALSRSPVKSSSTHILSQLLPWCNRSLPHWDGSRPVMDVSENSSDMGHSSGGGIISNIKFSLLTSDRECETIL